MNGFFTAKEFLQKLEEEDVIRDRVARLRIAAKDEGIIITYEAIAKYANCSISKVSKWMAGEQLMGPVFKAKILEYLDNMEGKFNVNQNI